MKTRITEKKPRVRALTERQIWRADDAAMAVLDHIDRMYPEMWSGVPIAARQSLRAVICAQVELALREVRP